MYFIGKNKNNVISSNLFIKHTLQLQTLNIFKQLRLDKGISFGGYYIIKEGICIFLGGEEEQYYFIKLIYKTYFSITDTEHLQTVKIIKGDFFWGLLY